jgi:ribonucleoside-triphosphate reductase
MKKLMIRTSAGKFEEQSWEKVRDSLVKEADLPINIAEKIAKEVSDELRKMNLKFVSGPLVREMVCVKLLEYGLEDARKKYTRVGMPIYDVTNLIFSMNKENANTYYNPEFVHKEMGSAVSREYALLNVIPTRASDAHMRGEIHIHTLEYFLTRPFCFEHSIPFFLTRGLKTDGLGIYTAYAKAPSHFDSAMMQLAKVLQVSQVHFSGGQGYDSFNVYLAPYVKGLTYKEIKRRVQYFIFDLDTMNFSRGGQTAFTNISLEFDVPKHMEDIPVFLPGGKVSKEDSYANYEKEARMIMRAFIENYLEGDGAGKPFTFPKPEFKLRKGIWQGDGEKIELIEMISKLASKFGTPYYLNMCPDYMPDVIQSQCCRYFLIPDSDQIKEMKDGKLRFGSLQVVSLNLPRLAYIAKDEDSFLELIEKKIDLTEQIFNAKRSFLMKYLLNGGSPFLTMDFDNEPYFVLEKQTNTVGFVGLNEAVQYITGKELHEDKESWRFGLKVVKYMRKYIDKKTEETGQRYGLVQTPAESTAHRFAILDLKDYGDKALVKGDRNSNSVYYTNSSHVYVGANIPLWERIKIESSFHPLVQGGAIMHVWLGEKEPDPSAIMEMTKKISTKSLCSYFAYTRDLTTCMNCNFVTGGLLKKCPNCGSGEDKIEWFSRITGYYTRIKAWNAGKIAELKERKRYEI